METKLASSSARILAALFLVTPPAVAQSWASGVEITPFDGVASDNFGSSVSVSGSTAVVGAIDAEAAYVYELDLESGEPWGSVVKLTSPAASSDFGEAVGISGDTIVVGGDGFFVEGAYVFERDAGGPGAWNQVATLAGVPDTAFGKRVAIDGDVIVVGAHLEGTVSGPGAAYVFERDVGGPGAWGLARRLEPLDVITAENFGENVAISGDTIAVGDRLSGLGLEEPGVYGAIHVFERNAGGPGAWGEVLRIDHLPSQKLSDDIVLSGDTLLGWGGFTLSNLHVYERDEGGPGQWGLARVLAGVGKGAMSLQGDLLALTESLAVDLRMRDEGGPGNWGVTKTVQPEYPATVTSWGSDVSLSGNAVVVGAFADDWGLERMRGLAYDASSGTLYGYGRTAKTLGSVDTATGEPTVIGYTGEAKIDGLAFDPTTATLYGARFGPSEQLYRLDTGTGAATPIGPMGFSEVHGLAFDSSTGTLYGAETLGDQLIAIDTVSGAGTAIGAFGFDEVEGLAYDAATDTLFGTTVLGQVITVDRTTGAGTPVGGLGVAALGLASDASNQRLFGIDINGLLSEIDAASGVGTSIGPVYAYRMGSAFLFVETPITTYCTAGTTTNGCQAAISGQGFPNLSNVESFQISVSNVEGNKLGLLYFGTTGAKASPWGSGTSFQCVKGPHIRTSPQFSGGTAGACDGSFQLEFNGWMTTHPSKAPAAGQTTWMQAWFRDPPAPKTTNFSDALMFLVCP